MKIVFYCSDKPREIMLARALSAGAVVHGDDLEERRTSEYGEDPEGNDLKYPGPSQDTEVACMFGVKGRSKKILKDHRAMGVATLFFDKGYTRAKGGEAGHTLHSRISVNNYHPLEYFQMDPKPAERWESLGLELCSRNKFTGGHVLYCGSSEKYHEFCGLSGATEYAQKVISKLRKQTERHLVYRPKPSWKDAVPIPGTSFSTGTSTMHDVLRGCHCVVTHGSSAAMDAVIAGVPALVIGDSIARPVAETDIEDVEKPFWPKDDARGQWACDMAYTQWTADELRSGEAWQHLKAEILRQCALRSTTDNHSPNRLLSSAPSP